VLRCTEVSQKIDAVGQKRGFERTPGMSAIPSIATESLHCDDGHRVPQDWQSNSRAHDYAPVNASAPAGMSLLSLQQEWNGQ
jgi:hypothetical protein